MEKVATSLVDALPEKKERNILRVGPLLVLVKSEESRGEKGFKKKKENEAMQLTPDFIVMLINEEYKQIMEDELCTNTTLLKMDRMMVLRWKKSLNFLKSRRRSA